MNHELFFEDYMRYLRNAWILEQKKLGREGYENAVTGDYLMDNVDIYDVTDRQYAGINDVIQDLAQKNHPVHNPKLKFRQLWRAQPVDRAPDISYIDQLKSYHSLSDRWTRKEWMYIWMVHRITGSAASYVADHGYRNTIIPELAQFDTIPEMADFIYQYNLGFYTSAGCQIPGFPKLHNQHCMPHQHNYSALKSKGQGKLFLCTLAPLLIDELHKEFEKHRNAPTRMTHREVMDFACQFNKRRKFNQFAFQYALFAADCSDYLPDVVDPESLVHYGTNSVKALKLMTEGGKSRYFDDTAIRIRNEFEKRYNIRLKYKGIENSLCDYMKYLKESVPKNYPLAAHVDKSRLVRNTSIVPRHLFA